MSKALRYAVMLFTALGYAMAGVIIAYIIFKGVPIYLQPSLS